ncbi:Alkylglycerol monooxygenase-like 2 [Homarus americanus]|uniref:Alkylglycerol monooxygenase-like 2 n=1 Tax=Homarus americanus TaxID=6706 RepID=A0A8J5MXK8_HOMAM|nr:Alkylglycerol monooxygenase-like 2 [Homarus americanus]
MGKSLLERVGTLLYFVTPNATSFSKVDQVPNYVNEAVPLFVFFIVVEFVVRYLVGQPARINEAFSSLGVGILHEATGFISSWVVLLGYQWLYQYRIWDLPWNSPYTWFGALILVDFCYYWIHRANHELNILWAVHQIHHSSEDYNLATSVRLSVLQRAGHFGFYHPLALIGFPVSIVVAHTAFNYLFQFWVHTEHVGTLGPIGWIFMTPSYHRVHHGSNKWCLDKNYASVFVIWDRIFGTFEPERDNEVIVYGLTEQPQTHNVLWHEAVFYGPGWIPGAPRLGDPDTFPDVKAPRAKYDPQLPLWQVVYVTIHLILALLAQQLMVVRFTTSSWSTVFAFQLFIFSAVGVTSALYDGWRWAPAAEAARCAAFTTYALSTPITAVPTVDNTLVFSFVIFFIFWTRRGLNRLSSNINTNKIK